MSHPTTAPTPSNVSSKEGDMKFQTKMKLMASISAALAIGFHAYLLKSHYDLRYGEVAGTLLCDISAKFSCSATSASSWSEFLGVPLALWGLLANLAFLTLAGWETISGPENRHTNRTSILVVALVLAGASVVMGGISFAVLNTICPFCVVTYVLSVPTVVGAFLGYRQGLAPKLGFSFVWLTLGFAIAGLFLNDQFRSSYSSRGGDAKAMAALSEWTLNSVIEIPETDPLAMGPNRAQAKMTIVEFADFRCIHCKHAATPLKAFLAAHPDTRLEFYSWPLDGECNTSIQQANGASCLLARVVWCARSKANKGWEAHQTIFDRSDEWRSAEKIRESLDSIAVQIGAPPEILKSCSDSAEAKSAIESQARLGTALSLRGTPAIFINGRLLPPEGVSITGLNAVHKAIKDGK
jgi:protein-disulfide isomerase/uncharacterized membrane protein